MPQVPAVSRGLAAAVAAIFEPNGALAATLADFEPRTGQRDMADAVARVIEDRGTLLAEAGTGTGKTLAYLVPAILSGRRVLVSTGTKNLQEQIFFKDLPILRKALGVSFRAAYMKGRGNYLCLHRFEDFSQGADLRLGVDTAFLEQLQEWARQTQTGDRAEVEDLPDDLPFWGEIAATSENCIGTECPRYQDCFVTRMRQQAAEADLVIVNHHLLCADAAVRQSAYGEVIPECNIAIIDEAHQLEDVATQYFGIAISNHRIDDLIRDGERHLRAHDSADLERAKDAAKVLERLRERARTFFTALGVDVRGVTGTRLDERTRVDARRLEPVLEPGRRLTDTLETLYNTIALLKDPSEDLRGLGARARELRDQIGFLLKADDPDYVYFLEVRGRGTFLRASPIDVSRIVREVLLERMDTTVLTSATLSVDGAFDYVRQRLGVRVAEELRLPAEFDYARQAILYLPRNMPEPRSPMFAEAAAREVIEILRRTRGRAFVLFTSYANLREVHARAQHALEFPTLLQGTAPRSGLLREFRETPHAVLFATSSFWQGVDVIGEALSCVIIDKLPFASPGDPITAARIEAITNRGDEPFNEYQVPLAILTLLQGLGRLIRHRRDRGVLAILDPRIRSKGYGRRFLASLPPAPVTHDLAAIERFFEAGGAGGVGGVGG